MRSRTFWLASAVVVAAPLAWFVYNAVAFGDWLEFARGPYSAKAIEMRTMSHGAGPAASRLARSMGLAALLPESCRDGRSRRGLGQHVLVLSHLGTLGAWLIARRRAFAWALLLWLPVPFYAYSVAYGSVPIFLPVWWPHSWYNTRYGMELLPALALGLGFVASFRSSLPSATSSRDGQSTPRQSFSRSSPSTPGSCCASVRWPTSKASRTLTRTAPIRLAIPPVLRSQLAERPGAHFLMETSVDPEIVALTGIPLRQTINESDLAIWDEALKAPAAHALPRARLRR